MARCFVTRSLPGPALDRLRAKHEVEVWPERLPPSYEELSARAAGVEGLLALLTDRIDAALIEHCPGLRVVSNYAVGYDNVDIDAAAARGIAVGNTPDVLTEATADLTWALLMAAARKLPEAVASVHAGDWLTWEPARYLGASVQGAVLGIVGFGRIGRAVARRASGFDMTVLYAGGGGRGASEALASEALASEALASEALASEALTSEALTSEALTSEALASEASLGALLEGSDFVTLHCPLTPATHHLIDAAALGRMRSNAILINTSRGPIVDPVALRQALEAGQIAGAALDVTEPEPLPSDDVLLSAPNLIVVPHIGSATRVAREQMAELAVENLLAGLDGRPLPHQVQAVT